MAWTGFPVIDTVTDIQLYSFFIQFWRASRERAWVVGQEFWPRGTLGHDPEAASSYCKIAPGYTGIIDSVGSSGGNLVFGDSSKSWDTNRWYDFVDGSIPDAPRFYDIIIEADELNPWGVLRAKILGNDATTLTVERGLIDDAVAAKQIGPVTGLFGKRYRIVRQDSTSHRSLHWHERWPEWPNAQELTTGIVATPTATTIDDPQQNWGPGQFVGNDLMTLVSGRLKRFPITANAKNQLTFTNTGDPPDAGAAFAVIPSGARWGYGRNRPAPWRWYGGADRFMVGMEADPRFYSHWPDNSIQPTPVAAFQLLLMRPDDSGSICQPTLVDAFDNDVWSATTFDEDPLNCDQYDRPYAPDFYKTLRALQGWIEGISPEFVEKKSYDNLAAIPPFTTATWFKAAGINHFTTTVSTASTSGGFHITFPAQSFPAESIGGLVHYAILDDNGVPMVYGFSYAPATVAGAFGALAGMLVSTTRIDLRAPTPGEAESFEYPPDSDYLDTWAGKTLVISVGWSRFFPREFRYFYSKTVFVAPAGAAPTEADPGFYVTRAASTRYLQYTEFGTAQDSDSPTFVTNELARYIGDNWGDPTLNDSVQDGLDPDTPYRDRLFTGIAPPEYGRATSGTARSLQDTTRSDDDRWWTEGVLRTDSGTAGGGATTSLSDGSKSTSAFWDGTTGRWAGFVVEIDIGGNWHRRPITSYDAGTQTLSWSEPIPSSAGGHAYRIREPKYELNRWKGRLLRLYLPGATVERLITHSDDDTIYFASIESELTAAGLTEIPAGTSYHILEAQPGQVWKWSGSEWVQPTGNDPRDEGDVPWHENPVENAPTVSIGFGRVRKRDYIIAQLLNELYDGINELAWTKATGFWELGADGFSRQGISVSVDEPWTFDHVKSELVAQWGTLDPVADSLELPRALAQLDASAQSGQAEVAKMTAHLDDIRTVRIKHAADAYAYTSTDKDDIGEYLATDDPFPLLGTPGRSVFFRAHGSGAHYRRFSLLASTGPTFNFTETIEVGDISSCPTDWPPDPAGDPEFATIGSWSVARPGGTGPNEPIIIQRWDVAGGMSYISP